MELTIQFENVVCVAYTSSLTGPNGTLMENWNLAHAI
jgi:hypothetical protein